MKQIFNNKVSLAFVIVFALVQSLFLSCTKDDSKTYLGSVQVSSSYVALDTLGQTPTTITMTANSDWTIVNDNDWLTVSPMSGSAGTYDITFTPTAAGNGATGKVQIVCGDEVQIINLIQGLATVTPATCAQVIAGPDSKTYRVTGTCTSIANTTYGNWYLADETGQVYIYGTLDKKGATKNFLSLGIEVGDVITVEGPKTTYNGTVELVDVTVINIEKSLIKVDSLSAESISKDGGNITAFVTCKGNYFEADIPESAEDWLFIKSIKYGDTPTATFYATPNTGGTRSATVTFRTYNNGKEYTSEATITQDGSIQDVSIADFLAAEVGDAQYRIQGVITKVAKAAYGNVYITDYSGEAYVYGIGSKGDFEALGLKVGDIVTVVGKRGAYNGSPQMTGGQYESHISVTEVTVSEFLALPDSKTDYYMVTGDITNIANTTYGNLYMSDGTSELYVYGCYPGWGASGDARKNWIATAGIEVGDRLTMIGYKDTYNGTIELCGGTYFSHTKPNQ